MFNSINNGLIFLTSLFYITQTLFLIILFKTHSRGLEKTNTVFFLNNVSKKFLIILVLMYAGLPPFFAFFFKILILLKLNTSLFVILLYLLINAFVLYYYLFFSIKIYSIKLKKINFDNYRNSTKLVSVLIHTAILNTFFFLLFSYILYF